VAQATHAAADCAPALGDTVPGAHGVHCELPVEAAEEPAAHALQLVAPAVAAMVPGAHCTQTLLFDAPTTAEAVPIGQLTQAEMELAEGVTE
jgi:hypothetical protein